MNALRKETVISIVTEAEGKLSKIMQRQVVLTVGYNDLPKSTCSLTGIMEIICDELELKESQLISPRRSRELVEGRCILSFILRKSLQMTFSDIGLYIGGRDHSTVMHQIKTCEDLLLYDRDFKAKYSRIMAAMNAPKSKVSVFGTNRRSLNYNYRTSIISI